MNQLQKDLKTALSWKAYLPYEKTYKQDNEAFNRLEYYMKGDLDYYWKLEMKQVLTEAINNERTELGKSVLKQLYDSLGLEEIK